MEIIINHYFLFSMIFGSLFYVVSSINYLIHFTKVPLFEEFFKVKCDQDVYYNFIILWSISLALSISWPLSIVCGLIYMTQYYSFKLKHNENRSKG